MKKLKSKKVYLVVLFFLLMVSFHERMEPGGNLQVHISVASKSTIEKSYIKNITYNEQNKLGNFTSTNFTVNLRPMGAQVKVGH